MLNGEEVLESLANGELSIVPFPRQIIEETRKRAGASIDLHLGRWFKTFKQTKHSAIALTLPNKCAAQKDKGFSSLPQTREHFVRFGEPFTIHPHRFVLGTTLEWLKLPPNISAQEAYPVVSGEINIL